jgi:hypothetical protein
MKFFDNFCLNDFTRETLEKPLKQETNDSGSLCHPCEATGSGPVIKRGAFIAHDTTRAMRRDSNTYTIGMAVTLVSEKAKMRGLSAQ